MTDQEQAREAMPDSTQGDGALPRDQSGASPATEPTMSARPWPTGDYSGYEMDVPRVGWPLRFDVCNDCGAVVANRDVHDRFHATGNHTARAIGVLVASHVGERPHSKYDVMERIGRNPAAWIGHKEIAHFAAEHIVDGGTDG